MWIPADWMVWTYIAVLALMWIGALLIDINDDKRDQIRATDIMGSIAAFAILFDWLDDRRPRSDAILWLLLVIYTLATIEAVIRALRQEVFEDEEEADAVSSFTVIFMTVLSLPIFYIAALMLFEIR